MESYNYHCPSRDYFLDNMFKLSGTNYYPSYCNTEDDHPLKFTIAEGLYFYYDVDSSSNPGRSTVIIRCVRLVSSIPECVFSFSTQLPAIDPSKITVYWSPSGTLYRFRIVAYSLTGCWFSRIFEFDLQSFSFVSRRS